MDAAANPRYTVSMTNSGFTPTFPRDTRVVFWRTGRAGVVTGNTLDDVTCTVVYDGHRCGCTVPTSALCREDQYTGF